jgi:hypothetical protein
VGPSRSLFGGICQEQDQGFVSRLSFGGREHCGPIRGRVGERGSPIG